MKASKWALACSGGVEVNRSGARSTSRTSLFRLMTAIGMPKLTTKNGGRVAQSAASSIQF